jgi:hypothetical protein
MGPQMYVPQPLHSQLKADKGQEDTQDATHSVNVPALVFLGNCGLHELLPQV